MGLWGAAQAIASGTGGFLGTALFDGGSRLGLTPAVAYVFVFALEVLGFLAASALAAGISFSPKDEPAAAVGVPEVLGSP
jgi:hypothetical protein